MSESPAVLALRGEELRFKAPPMYTLTLYQIYIHSSLSYRRFGYCIFIVPTYKTTQNCISKNLSWRYASFLTSSYISPIWRRIHKLFGKHPPSPAPVLHINDEHFADPLLVPNELGSFFSKISSGSHLPPQFTNIKSSPYHPQSLIILLFPPLN